MSALSVVIDARVLTGPVNGTQIHVLELIGALARTGRATVDALLPDEPSEYGRGVIERLPDVRPITTADAEGATVRADIAHRPFQVSAPAELSTLAGLGERLVITHQDLINFHNPSYFASREAWEGHRHITRLALAFADRVVFLSAHARDDALEAELVEPQRADVVRLGVDHQATPAPPASTPPAGAEPLRRGREAIVCIGTDYRHKNRPFALSIAAELQRRHGWDGLLVLAGQHVRHGSSAAEEARIMDADHRLREAVLDLGAVSEPEKAWLLDQARLVVYPTLHEGFGLVPFDALRHGVPCLWAPGSALSEILPDADAGLVLSDEATSAERALELLRDEAARARNLDVLARAGESLRWDVAANRLIDLYLATREAPPSPAGSLARHDGLMRAGFSEDAVRLVGPNGLLPSEVERPLLALASHPKLARPLFGVLTAAYRASRRWGDRRG